MGRPETHTVMKCNAKKPRIKVVFQVFLTSIATVCLFFCILWRVMSSQETWQSQLHHWEQQPGHVTLSGVLLKKQKKKNISHSVDSRDTIIYLNNFGGINCERTMTPVPLIQFQKQENDCDAGFDSILKSIAQHYCNSYKHLSFVLTLVFLFLMVSIKKIN